MRALNLTAVLVLIFVCVSPAFAQSDRGGITGRVTDQAGAVITDAKVTAVNAETNETREARTNAEGNYTIELSAKGDASNPNWLPIPEKDAYVVLRMYGPSKDVQQGKYSFPVLEVVNP